MGANGEVPGTDDLDAGAKRVNPEVKTISAAMDDKANVMDWKGKSTENLADVGCDVASHDAEYVQYKYIYIIYSYIYIVHSNIHSSALV